jgi:hypothetical protein
VGTQASTVRWKVVLEDGRTINLKGELEGNQRRADEEYAEKLRLQAEAESAVRA